MEDLNKSRNVELELRLLQEKLAATEIMLDESLKTNADLLPAARELKRLQSSFGFKFAYLPFRVIGRLRRR